MRYDHLIERALDNHAAFADALSALKTEVRIGTTYAVMSRCVFAALTKVSKTIAEPTHPIKVVMDFDTGEGLDGKVAVHNEGAWMVINPSAMLDTDWETIDQDGLDKLLYRIAQTFAHEVSNYLQYCRNWNHHASNISLSAPRTAVTDDKGYAADAARELLQAYGTRSAVIDALRHHASDAARHSTALRTFIDSGVDRARVRKFLSELYQHLQLI